MHTLMYNMKYVTHIHRHKVFKYPSLVASFFDVCMSLVCELVDGENNMCCLNLNE